MPLQFEFPVNLTAEQFIATISQEVETQPASRNTFCRTYYDSFDWRLYSNGISCEFNQPVRSSSRQPGTFLSLRSIKMGLLIASSAFKKVPAFANEFEPGILRDMLKPLLKMRALLSVCILNHEIYRLNIVNSDQKIILRLLIEEYSQFNNRVVLQAVKGYEKAAEQMAELLVTKLG